MPTGATSTKDTLSQTDLSQSFGKVKNAGFAA
jgi:hypothetical protein